MTYPVSYTFTAHVLGTPDTTITGLSPEDMRASLERVRAEHDEEATYREYHQDGQVTVGTGYGLWVWEPQRHDATDEEI